MSAESGKRCYERRELIPGDLAVIQQNQGDFSVQIRTYRTGRNTIAEVRTVLPWGRNGCKTYHSMGAATLNEADRDLPSIGQALAVARALGKLRAIIQHDTMSDVHERCKDKHNVGLRYLTDEELEDFRASMSSAIRTEKKRRRLITNQKAERRQHYMSLAQSKRKVANES